MAKKKFKKINSLFNLANRRPPSLYSRATSYIIKRDLIISKKKETKAEKKEVKKNFKKLITQLSQSFIRYGHLLLI